MPKTKSKDKSRLFELTPINEDDIVDQDYIVKQIGGTAPEYSEINNQAFLRFPNGRIVEAMKSKFKDRYTVKKAYALSNKFAQCFPKSKYKVNKSSLTKKFELTKFQIEIQILKYAQKKNIDNVTDLLEELQHFPIEYYYVGDKKAYKICQVIKNYKNKKKEFDED